MNRNQLFSIFLLFTLLQVPKHIKPSGRLTQLHMQTYQDTMDNIITQKKNLIILARKNNKAEFNKLLTSLYNDKSIRFYFSVGMVKPLAAQAIVFFNNSEATNPAISKRAFLAGEIIITNPLIKKILKKQTFLDQYDWGQYPNMEQRDAKFFDYALDKNCPDKVLLFLLKNEYFPGTIPGEKYAQKLKAFEEEEVHQEMSRREMARNQSKEMAYNFSKHPTFR